MSESFQTFSQSDNGAGLIRRLSLWLMRILESSLAMLDWDQSRKAGKPLILCGALSSMLYAKSQGPET